MPLPSEHALRAAQAWKLSSVPVQPRSQAGEHLGRGTGSSLEFQDRRVYSAGDDVRHLDWRAFARTGELTVKVYREELLPRLDVLLDTSASMAVVDEKAQLALDLAVLFALAARRQGFSVRVIPVGDGPGHLETDVLQGLGIEFEAARPLVESLGAARESLRAGTLRILISDFLSPHDAGPLIRQLSARAGGVILFQILSAGDAHPEEGTALRMEDAESGEVRDIVLDPQTVADYLARLGRLTEALEIESRRAGAYFLSLEAGGDFNDLCRNKLGRGGLLVPG
ncbi:MAG: hypothetical protein ACI9F9_000889 [Candidatus Paceibacteria bacterium]|jgi:uncharacterized protein (DUF58 family)